MLSAPGRPEVTRATLEALAATDLDDFKVREHPAGLTARQHVLALLEEASAGPGLVLILEDDIVPNRHLKHNCLTWPATSDPRFGGGWLYRNGGLWVGADLWSPNAELDGGCAMLFHGPMLQRLLPLVVEWFEEHDGPLGHDCALAWAIYRLNRRVVFHAPPLVEHRLDAPSLLGHESNEFRSTRQSFREDFRR